MMEAKRRTAKEERQQSQLTSSGKVRLDLHECKVKLIVQTYKMILWKLKLQQHESSRWLAMAVLAERSNIIYIMESNKFALW